MKRDYKSYEQEMSQRESAQASGEYKDYSTGPKLQFMSNLLKKSGDSIVVRFPYNSDEDFDVEDCHEAVLPGNKYPQKVECLRTQEEPKDKCPLCASGIKRVTRFLVKAVAYVVENGEVTLTPVVWDRPMIYADELKGKIENYGELSKQLFKITRNGTGADTTYVTEIVLNKAVYTPEVYKEDFSSLDHLDPSKILVRSMEKYNELMGIESSTEEEAPKEVISEEVASEPKPVETQPSIPSTPVTSTEPKADPTVQRVRRYSY